MHTVRYVSALLYTNALRIYIPYKYLIYLCTFINTSHHMNIMRYM